MIQYSRKILFVLKKNKKQEGIVATIKPTTKVNKKSISILTE